MGYVSLLIAAAFLIYMIAIMLDIGRHSIGIVFAIAAIVVIIAGIYTTIKSSRKQKTIRKYYEIQLNVSPAAQDFYDEALSAIKEKYLNPVQQTIPNCAALLGLPIIDGKSVFYKYYKALIDFLRQL